MPVNLVALAEAVRPYRFSAPGLAEALACMDRLGPRDGDGHHAASCDIEATVRTSDLQFRTVSLTAVPELGWVAVIEIQQATFEYRPVYVVPEWTNVATLSPAIVQEWNRYMRCLWVHERGHLTAAMPVIRQHRQRLQSQRIAAQAVSGPAAEREAQATFRTQIGEVHGLVGSEVTAAFVRYDARTRHGRSQGAELRVNARLRAPQGRR